MWTLATAAGALLFLCGGPRGFGANTGRHSLWELQRSSKWMTDHTVDDPEILYQDNMDWNYQDLPEIWSVPLTLERVRDQVDSRDFQLPGSTWSHQFCWVPRCLNRYSQPYLSRGLSSSKRKFTIETKWWQRPTSRISCSFGVPSVGWLPTNHLIFNPR